MSTGLKTALVVVLAWLIPAQVSAPASANPVASGAVRRAIVHQNLLLCYSRLNKTVETGDEFSILEKITPNDALLHYNYGVFLYKSGNLGGAIAQYRKACELDPVSQDYHGMLGCMLAKVKDYDGALSQLQLGGSKFKTQFETIKKYTDSLAPTKQHQQQMARSRDDSQNPAFGTTKKKNDNDE